MKDDSHMILHHMPRTDTSRAVPSFGVSSFPPPSPAPRCIRQNTHNQRNLYFIMYVTILPLLLCIVNFKMINFSDTIHEGIQLLREYLSSQNQVNLLNPGLKQCLHLIHLDNSLV